MARNSGEHAANGTENIEDSTGIATSQATPQSPIQPQSRRVASTTTSATPAVAATVMTAAGGQTTPVFETVFLARGCCGEGSGSRGDIASCNDLAVEDGDDMGQRTSLPVTLEHRGVRSASDADPGRGREATTHKAAATACSGNSSSRSCCKCKVDCWFACACSYHDEKMSRDHLVIVRDGKVEKSTVTSAVEHGNMKERDSTVRSGLEMAQGAEMTGDNTTRENGDGKRQDQHGPKRHHRDRSPTIAPDLRRAFLATSESRATRVIRFGTAPRLDTAASGRSAATRTNASGRIDFYNVW